MSVCPKPVSPADHQASRGLVHASAYCHEVLQGLCLVPLVDAPLDGDTTLRRATNVVCFMPLPMGFLPAELDLAFEGIDA